MTNIKFNKKRNRIKVSNLKDLEVLGYTIKKLREEFKIKREVEDRIYKEFEENTIYKVDDIYDFINYMQNIICFEREYKKVCSKFKNIDKLHISRNEYERKFSKREDVSKLIKPIEEIKSKMIKMDSDEDIKKIKLLEDEIDNEYIYSKDIELIKKMVNKNNDLNGEYDKETEINTIKLLVDGNLNKEYIKSSRGSVEYHNAIKSDIPRMKRLSKNIDKYIKNIDGKFEINQSDTLGDSINIAVAKFQNREFKAISGKNDIKNYCKVIDINDARFESNKVNKLGELGVGYRRINDSEKKIFEVIHKEIEQLKIKAEGDLILYSKWEPCPSCLYVISQFKELYPNININIKYQKTYG